MAKIVLLRTLTALACAAMLVTCPRPAHPVRPAGDDVSSAYVLAPAGVLTGAPVDGIGSGSMEVRTFHIHAHLAVYVNGVLKWLPHGIGVVAPIVLDPEREDPVITAAGAFYWVHTHDESGVIHMEAPKAQVFTLGEFFDLWGQPLSDSQVGPAHGPVTVLVDGQKVAGDPRALPLGDHSVIQLDVGTPVGFQPFDFPSGY